jgi:uncharacterized protein YcaQ
VAVLPASDGLPAGYRRGVIALDARDARRILLHRQGLGATAERKGRPADRVIAMLRRLGAVQLDTISVVARSHELVAYARLGAVGRAAVEAAYWGRPPRAFEYWAHAACVLPLEEWPWFESRRRRFRERRARSDRGAEAARAEVLARIADLGPVTTADLGGAKSGNGVWWDWSPLKVAIEQLLASGEVACVERRGWRRVYELTERVVPAELRAQAPPDDLGCAAHLVALAAERLGVGTLGDLADYFRLPMAEARAGIVAAGLTPVVVEGWRQPAWAEPAALAAPPPPARFRPVLLSPFDSLLWDRRRAERTLGFVHRLEAYVPRALREHGYFVMPLLAGGRIRGRVDPVRRGRTLVARRVSVDRAAVPAMARALVEAATWVGCDAVVMEEVVPAELAVPLRAEVGAAGG